eukprot:TRINITY_DN12298_c6_g2_i1.p1 TRINITY_DN12298_c6_g2~~TRINITY_DN12298_c6_g2_i1.p1  ORF type:complete len:498 (+),score=33.26 TRINITY_DN12298_c6_g2_i1:97-1494(+)
MAQGLAYNDAVREPKSYWDEAAYTVKMVVYVAQHCARSRSRSVDELDPVTTVPDDMIREQRVAESVDQIAPAHTFSSWWIKLVKSKLVVCGVEQGGENWCSSAIVRRIDPQTVLSKSGNLYRLAGKFQAEAAREADVPEAIIQAFEDSDGFPSQWHGIVKDPEAAHNDASSSDSASSRGDAKRPVEGTSKSIPSKTAKRHVGRLPSRMRQRTQPTTSQLQRVQHKTAAFKARGVAPPWLKRDIQPLLLKYSQKRTANKAKQLLAQWNTDFPAYHLTPEDLERHMASFDRHLRATLTLAPHRQQLAGLRQPFSGRTNANTKTQMPDVIVDRADPTIHPVSLSRARKTIKRPQRTVTRKCKCCRFPEWTPWHTGKHKVCVAIQCSVQPRESGLSDDEQIQTLEEALRLYFQHQGGNFWKNLSGKRRSNVGRNLYRQGWLESFAQYFTKRSLTTIRQSERARQAQERQ